VFPGALGLVSIEPSTKNARKQNSAFVEHASDPGSDNLDAQDGHIDTEGTNLLSIRSNSSINENLHSTESNSESNAESNADTAAHAQEDEDNLNLEACNEAYTGTGEGFPATEFGDRLELYCPLSEMVDQCIIRPVLVQYRIINAQLMNCLFVQHNLMEHMMALRRYVLMNAGDFIDALTTQLFANTNVLARTVIPPHDLNTCLTSALKLSSYDSDPYTANLSFVQIKRANQSVNNVVEIGDITLTYQVQWPICLVITPECMNVYHCIFIFLLKIKRAHAMLRDVWTYLKAASQRNLRQHDYRWATLELIRHEMLHFVNILQEYIINQILDICWKEFNDNLQPTQEGCDLDELRRIHEAYLHNALRRCMLNKTGAPVQQIIDKIFQSIEAFRTQLLNICLEKSLSDEFEAFLAIQKGFQHCAQFLYKILVKFNEKGYKPHLQQLIMFINFNEYYAQQTM
jgi:hypothetical protein